MHRGEAVFFLQAVCPGLDTFRPGFHEQGCWLGFFSAALCAGHDVQPMVGCSQTPGDTHTRNPKERRQLEARVPVGLLGHLLEGVADEEVAV